MNLSRLKKKNTQRLDEGETDGDRVDPASKAFRFPLVALVHLPRNLVGRDPGILSGPTLKALVCSGFYRCIFLAPRNLAPRSIICRNPAPLPLPVTAAASR